VIPIFYEPDPSKIDWKKYNVDIVMECSGLFTKKDSAAKHLTSGAKKVMVSAPCDGADNTVVYGVNDHTLTKDHLVISIGSCTTNCLAPIAKILNDTVGIDKGFMTTIHAYTNDQRVLDSNHKDLRRARACAVSMIPSSTGAAKALGLVLPELTGKLDGVSMRVPLKNVSFVDLKFTSKRATSAKEINEIIKAAKVGKMAKVLDYVTEELVSIDYNHSPFSSSFDESQTKVIGDTFCRIGSWYDNEWGFSNRMLDVAAIYAGI
jgi:glyceraldehyde 3-phosphate dehydrogenase